MLFPSRSFRPFSISQSHFFLIVHTVITFQDARKFLVFCGLQVVAVDVDVGHIFDRVCHVPLISLLLPCLFAAFLFRVALAAYSELTLDVI